MFNVEVKLHKGVDLPSADMNGKSDPYVVFQVGNTTRKSSCIKADLNPVWEPAQVFHFALEDAAFGVLEVKVYDHDRFTSDDLIGSCSIGLGQFVDVETPQVLMHELVIPNLFESQNRKSVLLLEVKVEEDEDN